MDTAINQHITDSGYESSDDGRLYLSVNNNLALNNFPKTLRDGILLLIAQRQDRRHFSTFDTMMSIQQLIIFF